MPLSITFKTILKLMTAENSFPLEHSNPHGHHSFTLITTLLKDKPNSISSSVSLNYKQIVTDVPLMMPFKELCINVSSKWPSPLLKLTKLVITSLQSSPSVPH